MHVSKTGGTTIKQMLKSDSVRRTGDGRKIVLNSHGTSMPEVLGQNPRNKVAFFLRHPASRFVSGFNSRLRQGAPSHDRPWRPEEKLVFTYFPSANHLAEALSSNRLRIQDQAIFAMHSITHTRWHMTDWIVGPHYLQPRLDRVAFVGFQETFAEDAANLLTTLGVADEVEVPHHHAAPGTTASELSEVATRNLLRWYADDLVVYEWMLERRDRWKPVSADESAPDEVTASEPSTPDESPAADSLDEPIEPDVTREPAAS